MSLFKKKTTAASDQAAGRFSRDVTQAVALQMTKVGITKMPALKFFNNDQGILLGLVKQHLTGANFLAIKSASYQTYVMVCAMHAFGAGVCVTLKQADYQKPVNEFTRDEVLEIATDFRDTDAYELSLLRLGVPIDSTNKKVLDSIISVGVQAAFASTRNKPLTNEQLQDLMQVLYNAGITMVLRV